MVRGRRCFGRECSGPSQLSRFRRPPGEVVAAHWDRVCGTLTDSHVAALSTATQTTLDLVNKARATKNRS
jgi:hypothetical protein